MRQVTLVEPGRFEAHIAPPPSLTSGHALIRIHRIGVCGTDLHAFAGRQPFFTYPRILGHELGVEILDIAPNERGLKIGDRCAVEPYLSCGKCHACRIGKPNCCENLQVLGVHTDGGMRGLLTVPIQCLHRSSTLSLEQLALVETLGIGQHAVERSQLQSGESVLIVGAGPIGLAVMQFAQARGGAVTMLELSPHRRAFVEGLGVSTTTDTGEQQFEVVFDATGNVKAMEASVEKVAFGGKLVYVGLVLDHIRFHDPLFHRREMTLLASRNSCNAFPTIIHQIESGEIDTTPWVTHRLGLSEVPEQFASLSKQPQLVKAMIEVSDADCDA